MARIGVFICQCGTNIASMVYVKRVVDMAKRLSGVVHAEDLHYTCSDLGQSAIKKAIEEHNLDRIVVSSCSPRMHEVTFQRCIESAGLNRYMFEMGNIREQCSWVHMDREEATRKAEELTAMAISKAARLEPLEPLKSPVEKRALVIGGGISGIQAALDLSQAGYPVTVVEKLPTIGGRMAQLEKTFPTLDCSA
jgi:heterodisulfide reductase subunit A